MSLESVLLALTVLVPFLAAPAIALLRRHPNPREAVSLGAAMATFGLAASLLPAAFAGTPASLEVLRFAPGFAIAFRADPMGLLFATISSFLWILTTVYSIGYMRGLKEHAQTRYYFCFAAVIGATMGVALSASLFSLLVFYEVLTVSTYPLVIHRETPEAYAAGRKYLVYTLGGGGAIIAGLAIIYGLGGDVGFLAGGNPSLWSLPMGAMQAAATLLIAGFGVKSTLMPLHGWLPSAMVAPTPVSGLLHAVAVVKAGVFGILRTLFFLLGPGLAVSLGVQPVLLAVAAFTIIVASLFALIQDNLKLRLAYSTISQLSYVVVGAALLSPDGLVGSASHIAAHGFAKLTMFFVAGIIFVETGKTQVSELDGIGRRMPATMAAFAIAVAAMAGLPPLATFVSKGYITGAAWEADRLIIVLVLSSSALLNVAYFFPIVARAFSRGVPGARRERRMMLAPILVTASGTIFLGLWSGMPFGPFEVARSLPLAAFPGAGAPLFDLTSLEHVVEVALVLAAAVTTVAVVRRRQLARRPGAGPTAPERAFLAFCGVLAGGFAATYTRFVSGIAGLGSAARRAQTGDLNRNDVGIVLGLLIVLVWLLWGVA